MVLHFTHFTISVSSSCLIHRVRYCVHMTDPIEMFGTSSSFFFLIFSCRCCGIFFMLGTISCSTSRRNLWKCCGSHGNLQCYDLYIRYNVLCVDLHQSTSVQYYEQQIPRCVQGKFITKFIKHSFITNKLKTINSRAFFFYYIVRFCVC